MNDCRVKTVEDLEKEICALREELCMVQKILDKAVRPMFVEWVEAKDAKMSNVSQDVGGDVAFV